MDLEYNLRGLLHLFFRKIFVFLLALLAIGVPGYYFAENMTPTYETQSNILLKFGDSGRLEVNLQGGSNAQGYAYNERSEMLQSNVSILESSDSIKEIINDLSVQRIYPKIAADTLIADKDKLQKAVEIAQKNLEIQASVNSHIIEIFFKHENAEMTALFVKKLISAFIERHNEIYETPQINFLEEQTVEAQSKLEQSRALLKAFKAESGISEIDQEIEQLLKQKNELSAIAYGAVTEARNKLAALETKRAQMRSTYRANSPIIDGINKSIAIARTQLNRAQSDMNKASSTNNGNSAKRSSIDKRIALLEEQRGRSNELEQQVKLGEENYKYYRQRAEEARVNNMLNAQNITRISVLDEAFVPLKPSGPGKNLLFIAVAMAALAFATMLILILELIDDRFSFPQQIRSRVGIPVFATFSKVKRRR